MLIRVSLLDRRASHGRGKQGGRIDRQVAARGNPVRPHAHKIFLYKKTAFDERAVAHWTRSRLAAFTHAAANIPNDRHDPGVALAQDHGHELVDVDRLERDRCGGLTF